jgi:hypothetical protein
MSWLDKSDLDIKNAKPDMLEKDIEQRVSDYAKRLGWRSMKFTSPNRRSVPDRIFTRFPAHIIFIEFKRLGMTPTKAQWKEILTLREEGFAVFVVDSVEAGRKVFDMLEKDRKC